ncbi:MAG: squalene synthase HpnC [Proteobacteria bacterium]|nr:squalene synthase HpnC [Pseudomonadota bacterium]
MTSAAALRSGKGHRDENFPVASRLVRRRHRGAIRAFYEFVRTADDVADHPSLSASDKIALLARLEESLLGRSDAEPVGVALRTQLAIRDMAPRHALDLLTAFRIDATKRRYRDWDELIDYCAYSAMPVGRFVLDVHGESPALWPLNDALCAALQIINHLQDCAADLRNLDRVYVPLEALAGHRASVDDLKAERAPPQLLACLRALSAQTAALLDNSGSFADKIADMRLSIEVSVITAYARRLVHLLATRDPLCERVHLGKGAVFAFGFAAMVRGASDRLLRKFGAAGN